MHIKFSYLYNCVSITKVCIAEEQWSPVYVVLQHFTADQKDLLVLGLRYRLIQNSYRINTRRTPF